MINENKKILFADDNMFFRGILKDLLEKTGYSVCTADNGDEALSFCRDNCGEMDLLVIDLLISGRPGMEVIEEIRRDDNLKDLTIVAMSGIYNANKDPDKFETLNISGYLDKSTPPEEIIFAINRLLFPKEKNSRRSERAPINLLIEYRINDSVFNGYLYTISEGGLFIRTTNVKPMGTVMDLAFNLPGMDEITIAQGEVVHVKTPQNGGSSNVHPPGMGVKFSSISPMDLDSIKSYVRTKSLEDSGKFKVR